MSRVRVFLLWLLMLAVPFQAYAAASMAFCDTPQPAMQQPAGDMHAAHAMHADSGDHAAHHHEAAASAAHDDGGAASGHHHSDALHKCGNCGACQAVALTATVQFALLNPLPEADLAEPALALATLAPRVLDKPPRA